VSQFITKIVLTWRYALPRCSRPTAHRTPAAWLFKAYSPLTWEDLKARRAGFEPATRCLEGTICALLEVG
jgi:hypothetical protein